MYGKFATVAAIEPEIIQALALRVYNCEPSLRPHRIEVKPLPTRAAVSAGQPLGPSSVNTDLKIVENRVKTGQITLKMKARSPTFNRC